MPHPGQDAAPAAGGPDPPQPLPLAQVRTVVLVHGLYLGPWSLALLARRLRTAAFEPRLFGYSSTGLSLPDAAAALAAFLARTGVGQTHFVGHSLGGLVVQMHLADGGAAARPPGRVVTLGAPHLGSRTARRLAARGAGRALGPAPAPGLLGGLPPWPVAWPLGVLAGSRGVGLGRLLGGLPAPNDGTVAVDESLCPGRTDARILPVSHTGLLGSRRVAAEVVRFLRTGAFSRR